MKTKHIHLNSFKAIPVFPLSHVHLFPGCLLPLHIFEPRYIELLNYARENDDLLAIADPQSVSNTHQAQSYCKYTPHLPPLVGAGVILEVKKTQFNTYNVILQGLSRLEVLEELPMEHRFRQLSTRLREDDPVDSTSLSHGDFQVRQLATQVGQWVSNFEETIDSILQHQVNPETLIHLLAAHVIESKSIQQKLFLETHPLIRSQIMEEELGRLVVSSLDESRISKIH